MGKPVCNTGHGLEWGPFLNDISKIPDFILTSFVNRVEVVVSKVIISKKAGYH